MAACNRLTTLPTLVLQVIPVNAEIEDVEIEGLGDQAASSSNLQPGREIQPALAKRILDFQGAVEDLTLLHVL
jgi:hypothetical protein